MRFLLLELLRPLELPPWLLSRGALVEESLSTRLDSVFAPDLLCVSRWDCEERPEPDDDDRLRPPDPLFLDEDDPLFAFAEEDRPRLDDEPCEPPERLLLLLLLPDREFFVGIQSVLPGNLSDLAYPQKRDRILLKLG